MRRNGLNPVDLRDTRYNQIIHMVSAANGAEAFYSTEVGVRDACYNYLVPLLNDHLSRLSSIYMLFRQYVFFFFFFSEYVMPNVGRNVVAVAETDLRFPFPPCKIIALAVRYCPLVKRIALTVICHPFVK